MPNQASTLRLVRQVHLYFGVLIAPALLFFAFTGALQTFSLHETTRGSDYKPPAWAVKLGQLHKKQTLTIPIRKQGPPVSDAAKPDRANSEGAKPDALRPEHSKADTVAPASPASPAATGPPQKSHLPMKIFFLLVSIGLFTSTLTGIYMSYKYNRSKLIVTALLVAGVIIPIALLPF